MPIIASLWDDWRATIKRETILTRLHDHDPAAGSGRGDHSIDLPEARSRAAAYHRGDLPATPAAVLVALVERAAGLTVLLTRRTDHLNDHAGQISFPGGRSETDDDSPEATALRETEEEIGLKRAHIDIVGRLDDYFTVTGYRVTPVVGFVRPPFTLAPDDFEVAEVFEVPLAFLMDRRNQKLQRVHFRGRERRYYAIPYQSYYIWGATAGMLVNLSEIVNGP